MADRGGEAGDALVIRLPVDADRPLLNAVTWGVIIGAFLFGFVVFDGRGLGQPVSVGLPVGGASALVAGTLAHLSLRRRTGGHRLVCDEHGIAFAEAGQERWRLAWDEVRSAQIVDGTLTVGGRHEPGFCTFLVLDLDPATAPRSGSLHPHEGRWWFGLLRADAKAPLVQRELQRRIPGRVERARHQDGVPRRLILRDHTQGRLLR